MNKLIILLFVILCLSKGYAQNIDSLKIALKNAKHDTTRCNILYAMVEAESDDAVWPLYNEQLLNLAEKCVNIASPNLLPFYKKHVAGALNNIGYLAKLQGDIPKALEYYHKALKIQEEVKDKKGIASSLNNIGFIYEKQGDNPKALEYYYKALKIREEIKDKKGISYSLNNIGIIYKNQRDIPKALEYYHKSLKIQEEIEDKLGIATSLNNIGFIYNNQGNIPKALEYYHKSLKIREEIKEKEGIAYSLINIANAMFRQGLVAGSHDYAVRSMQVANELGYPDQINRAASILKEIYQKQNKFKEAFEMYELEILMRDSINNETTKKASVQKQFQYEYEKKAAADSVANAKANEIKNAQIAQQKAEIKAKRNQQYALYGGVLVLVAFLGFVYNRLQITNKQKSIIEEQKQEVEQQKDIVEQQKHIVEEKNHEITQSIQYAQKIQSALLPSEEIFKTALPDSFVLFKPKDIVSGDFYWVSEKHEKYIFYATADSTGHGVPGGFMSMLGTALLNEIVDERRMEDCGQVLTLMREKIMQALKQAGDSESKDGMDMVLIRINKQTLEMQYAAANNSFYIVRPQPLSPSPQEKGDSSPLERLGEVLVELPCDKMPVGVYHSEVKPFQTFTYQLQKGDIIYTYTDGYADQFGGQNVSPSLSKTQTDNATSVSPSLSRTKKYTYKRLREKLVAISQESLEKQKVILDNEFESWKNGQEQIDDVCLIGVKL